MGWKKIIKEEGTDSRKHKDHDIVEEIHTSGPKRIGEIHLIAATLIAIVTFTAGFTLPGGYNDDEGSDHGMAVLTKRAAFKAFIITDTIAFSQYLLYVSTFSWHCMLENILYKHLIWGFLLTNLAMAAIVVAFMTGLYDVLPHSSGIIVATCSLCCCFFIFFGYTFKKLVCSSRPM